MGGTTAKTCIIQNGAPLRVNEFEVGRIYRFKKGSGLPVKIPVIEMIEIGAGGGSIASIGPLGLLKVGPESAGADPGPACYGRGGKEPTVTDADLILGYLDPDFFLGGEMKLPVNTIVTKEFDLRGAFRFHEEFETAVELLNKGLVDVKPLISATLPYRDAARAFALAADRSQAMKVLLDFD